MLYDINQYQYLHDMNDKHDLLNTTLKVPLALGKCRQQQPRMSVSPSLVRDDIEIVSPIDFGVFFFNVLRVRRFHLLSVLSPLLLD